MNESSFSSNRAIRGREQVLYQTLLKFVTRHDANYLSIYLLIHSNKLKHLVKIMARVLEKEHNFMLAS